MLLAIDIGNTSTTFGIFRGDRLVKNWRAPTALSNKSFYTALPSSRDPQRTSKYASGLVRRAPCLKEFLGQCHQELIRQFTTPEITDIIIASVVPEVDQPIKKAIKKVFGKDPIFVTYKNAGIKIGYSRPKEIGADRLADAVAAWKKYRTSSIVVDFGTATTFDYIDANGVYFGGPIAPGISVSNDALYLAAAKLPKVKLAKINKTLPTSTATAIQCGIYQGYIGLVEHLLRQMVKEVGGDPKIIATGGFAKLIAGGTSLIKTIEPMLTLEGLRIILESLQHS